MPSSWCQQGFNEGRKQGDAEGFERGVRAERERHGKWCYEMEHACVVKANGAPDALSSSYWDGKASGYASAAVDSFGLEATDG